MYQMISDLEPLEKALITLWLDENSYDDIADITGLSRANVAVKLHRIKDKLIRQGNQ
jgi:RNA polymerase sigma-70 factor (ECF subfamily)